MIGRAKILAFAGSTRKGSYNQLLVQIAAQGARQAGAEVNLIHLRDFPMPLYDGDLEEASGVPDPARRFKQLLWEHQGLLIAAPEYNSGISGVLKNAIDWASRKSEPGEKPLSCFTGKVAGIMSASPGALGGIRGLPVVRLILSNINVLVIPEQQAVGSAHEAFAPDGSLIDAKRHEAVLGIGRRLAEVLGSVSA